MTTATVAPTKQTGAEIDASTALPPTVVAYALRRSGEHAQAQHPGLMCSSAAPVTARPAETPTTAATLRMEVRVHTSCARTLHTSSAEFLGRVIRCTCEQCTQSD